MSALLITSDDVMATNVEAFQRIANFLCVFFFNQKSFGQVLTLTQKLTRFLSTARPIATPHNGTIRNSIAKPTPAAVSGSVHS